MNEYDVGDRVTCRASFVDTVSGSPVDPSTLLFRWKTPGGTITTYTYGVDAQLVRDSAGEFHVDVDVDISGTWWYRFAGNGASGRAAEEVAFAVARSQF